MEYESKLHSRRKQVKEQIISALEKELYVQRGKDAAMIKVRLAYIQ
jgi:hypothetical protein